MSVIVKQDSNGVKPLLQVGELGYDNYLAGGDKGRVYIGTGTENIGLAKKIEVVAVDGKADAHIARVDNPHNVTKAQVGLGNVDNTSDVAKNVLSATKLTTPRNITISGEVAGSASFDGSTGINISTTIQPNSVALGTDTTGNYVDSVVAGAGVTVTGVVGEGWSPTIAIAPVGTVGTYTKVTTNDKGQVITGTVLVASDIPSLDASKITTGTIDAARLPAYVDDVLEYPTLSGFPVTGETGKIYIALDTNKAYRWSGSTYVYITSGAVDSVAGKTGVVTLVKADVGLSNVDNTSDINKPISTTTQTALNTKVDKVAGKQLSTEDYTTAEKTKLSGLSNYTLPIASTTVLGGVKAGATVTIDVNGVLNVSGTVTSVAGKTGVVTLVKGDVGLGNVDNTSDINKPVSTATQTALDLKANADNAALTGVPTAPTATVGTNTTQLATTAFVNAEITDKAPTKTGTGASGTWGINITGNSATATIATNVSGGKAIVQGTGNDYNLGGVEVKGDGPANTVFPTIGFHQPALYGSSLQLRGNGDFRFYTQGLSAYANVTASTFIGNLSGNAETARYADSAASAPWSGITGKPAVIAAGDNTVTARMAIEAMGFNGVFPTSEGQDFNWLTTRGVYDIRSGNYATTHNKPSISNAYGTLLVEEGVMFITQTFTANGGGVCYRTYYTGSGIWTPWFNFLHVGNTTVDPNGFIKAASPIVSLYRDKAESNGFVELKEMQFERISTGHYRLTNVPKLSHDGWYIETPKDRNGNVYFTLDYVESENTLEILTYTPDYNTGRAENGAPVDIIDGRFVSLRFTASTESVPPVEV